MALNWTEFVDTTFLSGYDVPGELRVKIAKVSKEEVTEPKTGKKQMKAIIWFQFENGQMAKKGCIISKRIGKTLSRLHKFSVDAEKYVGTTVILYTTQEKYFGEIHPILNVKKAR